MNYSFQIGYYKAKQSQLLTKTHYETLSKLDDIGFFEQLRDYGFGYFENIHDFYKKSIMDLKKELETTLDYDPLTRFFFLDFDSLYTKLIAKHIHYGISYELDRLSTIDKNLIYNALKHRDYTFLNESDKVIFESINKHKDLTPKILSDVIEEAFLTQKHNIAKHNRDLLFYLEIDVTIKNILSLLRAKRAKLSKEDLKSSIQPFGLFDNLKAMELYTYTNEELERYFGNLYVGYIGDAVKQYHQNQDLNKLSIELEKDLVQILKPRSYTSDTFGPIMYYVFLKKKEIENIQVLYMNRNVDLDNLVIG